MCTPSLAIWRKLRRYRVKSAGESFRNTISYLQYAWKFFPRLVFPAGLEITALAFIWGVIPARFDMFFRHRNLVRRHFPLKRAGIIFALVFGFRGKTTCWRSLRHDWFSASMRRQVILDPSLPGVAWQESGSRTGLFFPRCGNLSNSRVTS